MSKAKTREEMILEIEWYCKELGMSYPNGFPDSMSDEEMEEWIEVWDEYDPLPDA